MTFVPLLASLHLISNSVITSPPNLRLEIQIYQLALFSSPLSIGISVVDKLITSSISDLNSCVRNCSLGGPLDVVAGRLGDEEWLATSLVAVGIDALLYGEVEDLSA